MGKRLKSKRIGRKPKGKDKNPKKQLHSKRDSINRVRVRLERDHALLQRLEKDLALMQQGTTARASSRTRTRTAAMEETVSPIPEPRTKEEEAEQRMTALQKNIIMTSSLPMGPPDDPCAHGRYGRGTPRQLADSIQLTLVDHPTSERIVEDISRWVTTLDLIVEHNGSLVPDAVIHRVGCSRTKRREKRPFQPSAAVTAAMKERCLELRGRAKCMVEKD